MRLLILILIYTFTSSLINKEENPRDYDVYIFANNLKCLPCFTTIEDYMLDNWETRSFKIHACYINDSNTHDSAGLIFIKSAIYYADSFHLWNEQESQEVTPMDLKTIYFSPCILVKNKKNQIYFDSKKLFKGRTELSDSFTTLLKSKFK